jgi:hypothetical protein
MNLTDLFPKLTGENHRDNQPENGQVQLHRVGSQ